MESNRACGVIVINNNKLLLLSKPEKYPFPWGWKQKSESNLTCGLHALSKFGVPLQKVQVDKSFKYEEDINDKKKLIVSVVKYQGDDNSNFNELQWITWNGNIQGMPLLSKTLNEYFNPSSPILISNTQPKDETAPKSSSNIQQKTETNTALATEKTLSQTKELKQEIPTSISKEPTKPSIPNIQKPKLDVRKFVVHCRKSNYDVYIGRPNPSVKNAPKDFKWGNPFKMQSEEDRDDVIKKYREWIMKKPELIEMAKKELKGKVLACWCAPLSCHGHVLAEIANSE